MFYFDEIAGKKILKSDLIKNAQAFFTTKEICICDKDKDKVDQSKNFEILKRVQNDKIFAIDYNKKLIAEYLKIEQKNLISPIQTHSGNVNIAKENKFNYPNTDGLILTDKNLAIFLNFADCTPLIFYDEKQNIGAVSHAGWRGTVQKIAQITVQKLINEYNSNPKDISVLIGPAICGKCYEVGEEIYNQLLQTITIHQPYSLNIGKENYYIDLKEINKKQLAELGIEKIDVCPYCTCCDNEYFFSYRKENGTTLRHSAVLKLS